MQSRAWRAFLAREKAGAGHAVAVRAALSAALADVPEPEHSLRIASDLITAELRIAELEAKLDALAARWEREAAEDGSMPEQHDEGGTSVAVSLTHADALRAILGGKEGA